MPIPSFQQLLSQESPIVPQARPTQRGIQFPNFQRAASRPPSLGPLFLFVGKEEEKAAAAKEEDELRQARELVATVEKEAAATRTDVRVALERAVQNVPESASTTYKMAVFGLLGERLARSVSSQYYQRTGELVDLESSEGVDPQFGRVYDEVDKGIAGHALLSNPFARPAYDERIERDKRRFEDSVFAMREKEFQEVNAEERAGGFGDALHLLAFIATPSEDDWSALQATVEKQSDLGRMFGTRRTRELALAGFRRELTNGMEPDRALRLLPDLGRIRLAEGEGPIGATAEGRAWLSSVEGDLLESRARRERLGDEGQQRGREAAQKVYPAMLQAHLDGGDPAAVANEYLAALAQDKGFDADWLDDATRFVGNNVQELAQLAARKDAYAGRAADVAYQAMSHRILAGEENLDGPLAELMKVLPDGQGLDLTKLHNGMKEGTSISNLAGLPTVVQDIEVLMRRTGIPALQDQAFEAARRVEREARNIAITTPGDMTAKTKAVRDFLAGTGRETMQNVESIVKTGNETANTILSNAYAKIASFEGVRSILDTAEAAELIDPRVREALISEGDTKAHPLYGTGFADEDQLQTRVMKELGDLTIGEGDESFNFRPRTEDRNEAMSVFAEKWLPRAEAIRKASRGNDASLKGLASSQIGQALIEMREEMARRIEARTKQQAFLEKAAVDTNVRLYADVQDFIAAPEDVDLAPFLEAPQADAFRALIESDHAFAGVNPSLVETYWRRVESDPTPGAIDSYVARQEDVENAILRLTSLRSAQQTNLAFRALRGVGRFFGQDIPAHDTAEIAAGTLLQLRGIDFDELRSGTLQMAYRGNVRAEIQRTIDELRGERDRIEQQMLGQRLGRTIALRAAAEASEAARAAGAAEAAEAARTARTARAAWAAAWAAAEAASRMRFQRLRLDAQIQKQEDSLGPLEAPLRLYPLHPWLTPIYGFDATDKEHRAFIQKAYRFETEQQMDDWAALQAKLKAAQRAPSLIR